MKIAVLMTCHNRVKTTLKCLHKLYKQIGLGEYFSLTVFLVDDGSTDGTETEVKRFFPQVTIIKGDGDLFWNRGMHLAWLEADRVGGFDYFLWLNDDTLLKYDAFSILFTRILDNSIICGTTYSEFGEFPTYGGYLKGSKKLIIPNGEYINCDYCNGNCVLIPKSVFKKLGYLDSTFHHALGDFDYSLRARKKGIEIFVAPDYVGSCETHESIPKWRDMNYSWSKRIVFLYHPSSGCKPSEYFIFDLRHRGIFFALIHFFTIHVRAFFPKLWKYK